MYLTKQLTLFKTPLSPTYENVYDDYSTYTDYENFLLNNFSHIEIDIVDDMEVGRDKSVIDKNGIFSLVVKNHSSMDIHDYNYCCFETDKNTSSPLFAFILSVDSLNDSRTSPSCRINCQLDAWTHNYFEMHNPNAEGDTEIGFCNRRTISDIAGIDSTDMILAHDDKPPELPMQVKLTHEVVTNHRILFAIVRTDREFITEDKEGTEINPSGAVKAQDATPIFFVPVLFKNQNGAVTAMQGVTLIDSNNVTQTFDFPEYVDAHIDITNSTHVLEGVLSYIGLSYTFDVAGIRFSDCRFKWLRDPQSNVKYFVIQPTSFIYEQFIVERKASLSSSVMPKSSIDISENMEKDPAMLKYPIIQDVLSIDGDEIIPLDLHDLGNVANIIISRSNSFNRRIQISGAGSPNDPKFYTPEYNKKLMLKYSSSDLFMRNNSASYKTSMALAGINAVAGTASLIGGAVTGAGVTPASIGMIEGGIISGVKQYAKKVDADNGMDTFTLPSSIATDEMGYTGDIFICQKRVVSDYIKRKYYLDIHYYGSYLDNYRSLFQKERYDFDFVQCKTAQLQCIGNIDDRRELQNAFYRGIRQWHITSTNTTQIRQMDKNISNIPLVLLPYAN